MQTKIPVFQATGAFAITKSDTNSMETQSSGKTNTAALFVTGTGDVTVTMAEGEDVTFAGIAAGTFLPIVVTYVKAATTATGIIGLYTK